MKDKHKSIDEAKLKANRAVNHKDLGMHAAVGSRNFVSAGLTEDPEHHSGLGAGNRQMVDPYINNYY